MSKVNIAKRFYKAMRQVESGSRLSRKKGVEKEMEHWVNEYNKAARTKSHYHMNKFRRNFTNNASQDLMDEMGRRDLKHAGAIGAGTMGVAAGADYYKRHEKYRKQRKSRRMARRHRKAQERVKEKWWDPEYIKRSRQKRLEYLKRKLKKENLSDKVKRGLKILRDKPKRSKK